MPIDPRTLLYGLADPQARTPYDAQDVVAERRAHVEQLREAAKARQEAEYDNQLYDWAMKSNLGPDGTPDIEGVRKALYSVAPRTARKFDTAVTTAKKSQLDALKLQDEHEAATHVAAGQMAIGTTAENYALRKPHLESLSGLKLPDQWDDQTAAAVQAIADLGTSAPEQLKVKKEMHDDVLGGKYLTAMAKFVEAQPNLTDDDVARQLNAMRHDQGMPLSDFQTVNNIPVTDKDGNHPLKQWAADYLHPTTPHEKVQEQQAKDTLEATKESRVQAEVDRREAAGRADRAQQDLQDWRDKQYGLQQRTASRADAQLAMKQRSAAAGLDPDAVAGWVQHVMDNGTFVGVPANVKNQVMGELKRLNVNVQDLTNADLTRRNVARTIEPKIEAVKEMAKQIDQMGLTGTLGGRWRKIVSGETAASDLTDLTPAQKQLVGKFATEASGLLLSGIAMAHGGARGGGSPQLLEQIKQYLDPGNKDLNVYLGNLDGAKEFIHGYATMGQQAPGAGAGGGAGPKKGDQKPITDPGYPPGAMQEYNGVKWIRIK